MLIKINQLNDTCDELESEVADLKKKIRAMLKQEQNEKKTSEQRHLDEVKEYFDNN